MPINAVSASRGAVNFYVGGLACIMVGACLMDYFDSLAPLAAGVATAMMLSAPLFRLLTLRYLARHRP